MIVVRGRGAGGVSEKRGATFSGEVWADPVISGVDGLTIATIFFTPGARTFWHHHERGQILVVTAGTGWVCTHGETPQPLTVGDVVWVPPGEQHWHGAGPDSIMTHLATSLGTTWLHEVSADEYGQAGR